MLFRAISREIDYLCPLMTLATSEHALFAFNSSKTPLIIVFYCFLALSDGLAKEYTFVKVNRGLLVIYRLLHLVEVVC